LIEGEKRMKDQLLEETEKRAVAKIVGQMIPESAEHGLPAANDPAILEVVFERLQQMGERFRRDFAITLAKFGGVEAVADSKYSELTGLLTELQKGESATSLDLITATCQAYYEDRRVMTTIGREVRPPFPVGNAMPDGDWSVLDEVKDRDPIYRQC